MAYSARILADSISQRGHRLTTMEITYPRMVHSELMTHRMFSRNSASSRAIPITKMIERVQEDPVLPVWWGKNQSGMQAAEELTGAPLQYAQAQWLAARDDAVNATQCLNNTGLHKQIANRLLEPWMWITVIVSATEWSNFFYLRCHPDAQPEIRHIAEMMQEQYEVSAPHILTPDDPIPWHLPLVTYEDLQLWAANDLTTQDLCKLCVGRCARVSYLTHDGRRDPQADLDLHDRLALSGHYSPFEHVAQATDTDDWYGNFHGWHQYRKMLPGENYNGTV